jgi:hypothetical protein
MNNPILDFENSLKASPVPALLESLKTLTTYIQDYQPPYQHSPLASDTNQLQQALNSLIYALANNQPALKRILSPADSTNQPSPALLLLRRAVLPDDLPHQSMVYDEKFKLSDEVSSLVNMVRAIRNRAFPDGTHLDPDLSISEAKDVLSMTNTTIATLMKSHEKLVNMERFRAMEVATIDTLNALDSYIKDAANSNSNSNYNSNSNPPEPFNVVEFFVENFNNRMESSS